MLLENPVRERVMPTKEPSKEESWLCEPALQQRGQALRASSWSDGWLGAPSGRKGTTSLGKVASFSGGRCFRKGAAVNSWQLKQHLEDSTLTRPPGEGGTASVDVCRHRAGCWA